MSDLFAAYDTDKFYDEMFAAPGRPRPHYQRLFERFSQMEGISDLLARQRTAFVDRNALGGEQLAQFLQRRLLARLKLAAIDPACANARQWRELLRLDA